ncbi:MAG: hypothetical protein IID45_04555, partial [Planctomycetes bacterium]|nr:hypothetical protein [Planctomycetota bacterium]
MTLHARVLYITMTLASAAFIIASCSRQDEDEAKREKQKYKKLSDVIKIVSPDFFSGKWRALGLAKSGGEPLIVSIDMKKRKLRLISGLEEAINEAAPVDSGYALLLYVPNFPKPKEKKGI